tara:strand:- start:186 stop:326 length:141 start_codon:yes stop_codon:yes gene_type:complete
MEIPAIMAAAVVGLVVNRAAEQGVFPVAVVGAMYLPSKWLQAHKAS